MDGRFRHRLLSAALAVTAGAAPRAVRAQSDSLPSGVTPALVAKGKSIFQGAGLCVACHGPAGKGGGVGPDLTDSTRLHGDGTFDGFVRLITAGVALPDSKTGQIMPPKGGSAISEADIRAVAAYVWTLERSAPGHRARW